MCNSTADYDSTTGVLDTITISWEAFSVSTCTRKMYIVHEAGEQLLRIIAYLKNRPLICPQKSPYCLLVRCWDHSETAPSATLCL